MDSVLIADDNKPISIIHMDFAKGGISAFLTYHSSGAKVK